MKYTNEQKEKSQKASDLFGLRGFPENTPIVFTKEIREQRPPGTNAWAVVTLPTQANRRKWVTLNDIERYLGNVIVRHEDGTNEVPEGMKVVIADADGRLAVAQD
jgi:hypothetical protein